MSWGLHRDTAAPPAQPLSGAALLVLPAGWPMTVLCLPCALTVMLLTTDLGAVEALHRVTWLGRVPATLSVAMGAVVRRWLPPHLFVYIRGRAFLGTFTVCVPAGAPASAWHARPPGVRADDLFVAQPMGAFAEAFLTGLVAAILVACCPHALATYSDRLDLTGPT